ncbi:MAG: hypothetical protein M1829_005090 [Trizodia sp. TS-e1964]|nr:MAG: hypothetical protein M1829_005090 [Trizodia sp. TS-e1964]
MSPSPRPAPTYHALPIASLTPGPLLAQLTCRIANVHLHPVTSSADSAAKFVAHLVLQDPSGALLTKLYFAAAPPLLTLGAPCILRTPHLSPHPASAHIALCTSVFPERDALSGFTLLTPVPGSNKMPLPPSLMTLAAFLALAPDVPCAGSILVCVRSVGPLKTLEGKHGQVYEKTEVRVADVSGETKLALWGAVGASARAWVVDHTVLGILAPVLERGGGGVGLGMESVVTVDPAGEGEEEVGTLREWAKAERLRRGVNPVVPARWLNVKEGRDRILFSLGELDDFARSFPEAFLTGYLSLIILDVSLCALSHRVQLCAAECCGIPLYANAVQSTCLTCLRRVVLHPNPKLVVSPPILAKSGF